ncbi:hypothetical protein T12_211 [Trichinella patagoniensis]|uniref:CCHC-type domain-containing protein n=1 Tax=Trichinella patagoniensis TaxID=990121 RepID=A0A0V1A6T0_9BILA|nr:hypothetical protein T12_3182 [Trichinella patagoniensis]KRY20469.1 hypothetical protein T12_211 [Trichinella patagoniensis]
MIWSVSVEGKTLIPDTDVERMKEEMTKKIEELTKKLDCTKRRVNDLMMEIQHRCAENAEIERIEIIVAEMDRIFCLAEDLQWSCEDLLNENDLATKFGAFWDQFQASVHSQTDLNDIEKFMYLRSSLKGPALDVISGFSTTATNYPEAVKTLRERFDRADLIIQHHIIQIADIKKITQSALRAVGKDPITSQLTTTEIFLALFQKAMPSEVNRKWEELIESNTSISANLESFLEFVRKQMDIEEKVIFTKEIRSTGVEKCSTTIIHENRSEGMTSKYTTSALQVSTRERTRCQLCHQFHEISACTQFLAIDVDECWRIAKRLGLCLNCLKKGHRRIDCIASRKTATGEVTIHDLLNKKDTEGKKTDEKTEENITRVFENNDRSSSYSNGNLQIAQASLGLNGPKEHITISTLNQPREHHKLMQVELYLKGIENDHFCVINALCVSHICDKVHSNPPMEEYEHLKGLKLADQFSREEVEIDLLIRVDYYYVKTIFGWVICGKNIPQNRTHLLHCQVDEECKCECDIIKKFWELEALGIEIQNEFEVNGILKRFKDEVEFDGE